MSNHKAEDKVELRSGDSFSKYLDMVRELSACKEFMDYASRYEKDTIEVAYNAMSKEVSPSWAAWALQQLGSKLEERMRHILIGMITDPMQAFSIHLDCDYLTAEEDKLLEEKFNGKLPRAEQELREGIVRRKKTEVSRG